MYRIELTVEEKFILEYLLIEKLKDDKKDLKKDLEAGKLEGVIAIDKMYITIEKALLRKTEKAKEVDDLNLRLLAELIEDHLSFEADTDITGTTGELREELKKINVLINGGE